MAGEVAIRKVGEGSDAEVVGYNGGKGSMVASCKGSIGDMDWREDLERVCPWFAFTLTSSFLAARFKVDRLSPSPP